MENENMSIKELKEFEEENLEINEDSFEVNEGICKECNEKLIKIVENRSILDGAITFHVIKLKCMNCGKQYLDLDQAEKYDLSLTLEKVFNQPLETVSKKMEGCV